MNNGGIEELRKKYNEAKQDSDMAKKDIISKISRQIKVEENDSNQILVYCGLYIVKKYSNGIVKEYLTYDDNPKGTYKLYMDMETCEIYKVGVEQSKMFETKYAIVKPHVDSFNYQEYMKGFNKVRNKFLSELITSSQDKAIKKVLAYKKDNLSI